MIDELGRRRERRQERLRSSRWRPRRASARARAGRRRGARLRRAGRQQLGKARIEPDDGVLQMAGGEELDVPAVPALVDLEEDDLLALERADVEAAAARPAAQRSAGG